MKKLIIIVCALALSVSLASAAATEGYGYQKGAFYLGPTLGLAYSGFGLGVNGEYALDKNWGIGGEISYTTFSNDVGLGTYGAHWKYTFIGVLAAGSYHFIIQSNRRIDPYLKGGLGYFNWSASYSDNQGNRYQNLYGAGYSSGIGIEAEGGLRYFFKPKLLGRVQVGFPFYLGVGLDFVM
jgi:hypothetical protein